MIWYIKRCQLVANLSIYSFYFSLCVLLCVWLHIREKKRVKTDKFMNISLFVIDIRKSDFNYCAVNKNYNATLLVGSLVYCRHFILITQQRHTLNFLMAHHVFILTIRHHDSCKTTSKFLLGQHEIAHVNIYYYEVKQYMIYIYI